MLITGRDNLTNVRISLFRARFVAIVYTFCAALSLPSNPVAASALEMPGVVDQQTVTSEACVNAFAANGFDPMGACSFTVAMEVSGAQLPSLAQLRSADVIGSDATVMTEATALATVRYKDYAQYFKNITDQVRQYGRFYYDGSRAWVGVKYNGVKGTHFCKIDWSVGYSISLVGCTESGGIAYRNLHMQWHYSVLVEGFPIQWDELHTVTVNKNGVVSQ